MRWNVRNAAWGSVENHMQDNRFLENEDLTDWHTYGAIVDPVNNTITYTFDGKPWFTLKDVPVTSEALWIGFQSGAQDPLGSFAQYESIDHGIPGKDTPAVSDIEIDWVAHYRPSAAPKILTLPEQATETLDLDKATDAATDASQTPPALHRDTLLLADETFPFDTLPATGHDIAAKPLAANSNAYDHSGTAHGTAWWENLPGGTEIY